MSEKDFRYLNKSHCHGRTYITPGSDKPCELHNIFNAMVASTRPKQSEAKMTEQPKTQGRGKSKTPEQHLAEAKAMTLFGIKVLDETPRKVGLCWQILIECERCGNRKWVNKGDLSRTKSCGCLYAERSKKRTPAPTEPKPAPFEIVEIVEKTVENKQTEVMTTEEKTTLMDILEKKQTNAHQCDEKADCVCVSRRLVDRLARDCGNKLQNFWLLHPVEFNALMRDAKELYEALK